MRKRLCLLALSILACAFTCSAQRPALSAYQQLARDIFCELVEMNTAPSGVGSTPAAEAMVKRLIAAGFLPTDVRVIGPSPRKKNLIVRFRGKGQDRPILLFVHLDTVEARKVDWSPDLDPFRFIERDGFFYGRGTQDVKDVAAILVTNFSRWKQEGWVPQRDILLALTADEDGGGENGMKWLVQNLPEMLRVEYAINADAGDFRSRDGKPYIASISSAEKKYLEVELRTTNRGGHAAQPRKDNAIYELVDALGRLANFQFPPILNEISRAQFAAMAKLETGKVAADMGAVAQGNADAGVMVRLSEDPYYNALLRTTCVATQVEAGHAPNALPVSAKAVLNCRLLPGHDKADVLRSLVAAIGDRNVEVASQFEILDAPPSPLRPDLVAEVDRVAQQLWQGVAAMPVIDVFTSDSTYLRAAGIPTYGIGGVFIDEDDVRAHGRDERIRVRDFYAGLEFFDLLLKALAGP
jgi:acetylornithine deacetylase/succinyl-diaminopimelate desuccinylase-like protein